MRSAVGSFVGPTSSTHALGATPKALVGFQGSTANTTHRASILGLGFAVSTASSGQIGSGLQSSFGTSAVVQSTSPEAGRLYALPPGLAAALARFESTVIEISALGAGADAAGFGVLAGDDVSGKVTTHTVTTATGTTQASTGYGFQPNAAFVLSQAAMANNRHSISFGFVGQDSAGTISQWSITNFALSTNLFGASRMASTVYCSQLLASSVSTFAAMKVTSVRSSGFELTCDTASTVHTANLAVLGLKVPRVAAGVATITTNGVGAGVTGFTVSGLGNNVGLVCLASIHSSVDTPLNSGFFSIGFASSDNSQRSVAGGVNQSTTEAAGYFNTSCAYTFVNPTGGPAVTVRGTYAQTSDGFTLTCDSTLRAGTRVFYAAMSNVVTDIEAHIFSSGSVNALVSEVQRIAAAVGSTFTLQANTSEVSRIAAQIGSTFNVDVSLEKEFETTEGKMRAQATIGARIRVEDESYYVETVNSSSPDYTNYVDVTTARTRLGLASHQNAKSVSVIPSDTNTVPMRLAAGRTSPGIPISSQGQNLVSISEQAGTDLYLYTTESGSTVENVRVIIR